MAQKYLTKKQVKEAIKEERAERWHKFFLGILYTIFWGLVATMILLVISIPLIIAYGEGNNAGYDEGWKAGNDEAWKFQVEAINNLDCGTNVTFTDMDNLTSKTLYTEDCVEESLQPIVFNMTTNWEFVDE